MTLLKTQTTEAATKSIGQKIVSGTAWMAVEAWSRQTALFVIFVVLAHLLGPDALGLAALAVMAPGILAVLVTKGLPEAIIQRAEIDPIHLDSVFWFLVVVGAMLSGLSWLLAGFVAAAFDNPLLEDLVHLASVIVVVQALASVPSAVLQRQLNFRLLALRTIVGTAAGGLVGISTAIAGYGVWSLVWMQVARSVVETATLLLGSGWRPRLRYSHARCRELFGFSGPIVGISLWNFVNDELPKAVLGALLGPHDVGIYVLARRILDVLTAAFLNPLTAVAMPVVSGLRGDPARIERFFDTSVRITSLIGFPVFIGFAAAAPLLVPLLLGSSWHSAILAVQILMFLGPARIVGDLSAATVLAFGHSGVILKINMTYTILGAILFTATARISVEAMIATLVACNLILLPVFLFLAHRLSHIDVVKPLTILPRLAIALALMFFSVTVWQLYAPANAPHLLVAASGIVLGVAVYGAAAMILIRPDLIVARDMLLRLRS